MIYNQTRIAKAASDADRTVELESLTGWATDHGIDVNGLLHVANQRALRTAMVVDGKNPTRRTTTTTVRLSPFAQTLLPALGGIWVDGFATGFTISDYQEAIRLAATIKDDGATNEMMHGIVLYLANHYAHPDTETSTRIHQIQTAINNTTNTNT